MLQLSAWTDDHDRNKMEMFATMFAFDEIACDPDSKYGRSEQPFNFQACRDQLENWLARNSTVEPASKALLEDFARHEREDLVNMDVALETDTFMAWNWTEYNEPPPVPDSGSKGDWDPTEENGWIRDQNYKRVSHEIDVWWEGVHEAAKNQPTSSVELAELRQSSCRQAFLQKCSGAKSEGEAAGFGPITQLCRLGREPDRMPRDFLYRMTTTLDQSQIQCLFKLIKSCILDSSDVDADESEGECYQRTRCKIIARLPSGRVLLQGLLDFVDMWDLPQDAENYVHMKDITRAFHQNFLVPFIWDQFYSPSQLISPAQGVLLRLVTDIIRSSSMEIDAEPDSAVPGEKARLAAHASFFFEHFRSWVVPQYAAIMNVQAHIREGKLDSKSFPLNDWQMLKARTTLADYLDLIDVLVQCSHTRALLIEWEAVYELISLLAALDRAVPKLAMVPKPDAVERANEKEEQEAATGKGKGKSKKKSKGKGKGKEAENATSPEPTSAQANKEGGLTEAGISSDEETPITSREGHLQAWAGIKGPIFTIIAILLQPTSGRSTPGNPVVQKQILQHDGLPTLLNCMMYDGHQPYARERVTLCLKWLVEGNKEASDWFRGMFAKDPDLGPERRVAAAAGGPGGASSSASTSGVKPSVPLSIRMDGVNESVKVEIRAPNKSSARRDDKKEMMDTKVGGMTQLEEDFMA